MQVDCVKLENPAGYENVLLHMKMHKDMDMQKQMEEMQKQMMAQMADDAATRARQPNQQAHRKLVQANRIGEIIMNRLFSKNLFAPEDCTIWWRVTDDRGNF